jgi:hypothetical protein
MAMVVPRLPWNSGKFKPPVDANKNRIRDIKVKGQGDAIRRRLMQSNVKNEAAAKAQIKKQKGGSATYKSQYIRGSNEGFSPSDFGIDAGAAIPYQIGTKTHTIGPPTAKKAGGPASANNKAAAAARRLTKK